MELDLCEFLFQEAFHVELTGSDEVPLIYHKALKDSGLKNAAENVAKAFLRHMFVRYPSPSGSFGFIAQGRE